MIGPVRFVGTVFDQSDHASHIYKYGNPGQASRYIAAALSSLRVSAQNGMRFQEGLQHIIAGILICSFEVNSYFHYQAITGSLTAKKMHLFSQPSSTWLLYLSGTKAMINQFYQNGISEDSDQTLLFQWVFYYDTFARLGMRHWHGYRSLGSQLAKELTSQLTNNEVQ